MRSKTTQHTLNIFTQNQDCLNTVRAKRLGIQPRTWDAGLLVQKSHGSYRLADRPAKSNPDFALVALRIHI